MPMLEVVRRTYPRAHTTHDVVEAMFAVFDREFGLAPSQIMHADSICADDLNTIEYPPRAYEMLGPFNLGGLNGFPFAGLTGMAAFAGHVPIDGAVFVFHAPHIGITKTGSIGEIMRPGQVRASGCCGAARAALAKLERGELRPGAIDELDYQQNVLEQILLRQRERVLGARCRIVEATEVFYEAIEERLDLLASKTKYPCSHLFLMGGILVNGDHDVGSFCEVRRLVHVEGQSGSRRDLMSAFRL
jgi:hypothetical protein